MDTNEHIDQIAGQLSDMELEALLQVRERLNERIKEARKEAKEAEKERKQAEKEAAMQAAKEKVQELEEGDEVAFILKGETRTGTFVKVTEKRFTVEMDGVKKSIMFDKFLGYADEVQEVVDNDIEEVEVDDTAEVV